MQTPALTYHDWIANHALRRANAPAAIDLATGRRFTYGHFHARIDGIAAYLADDLGGAPGDRVAVLAMGSTDVFEIQFACARIGAIFVPLNWRLATPELGPVLNSAK
jgi:fatty-acyl-CoA synthase